MKPRVDEVNIVTVSETPTNVSFSDLDSDLFLVDKSTREKILNDEGLQLVNNGRLKKKEVEAHLNENLKEGDKPHKVNYDIQKIDGEYYAVYSGVTKGDDKIKGYGGSGVTKSAQNLRTGGWIAVKYISKIHHIPGEKPETRPEAWFDLETAKARSKEFDINKKAGINLSEAPLPERLSPKKGRQHAIAMKDAGMSLTDFLNAKKHLHPTKLLDIYMQMSQGLNKVHNELNLIHRDFKLDNILIDSAGNVRVIDFGLAIERPAGGDTVFDNRGIGTNTTWAPESVNNGEYSVQSDAFSLGASIATSLYMTSATGSFAQLNDLEVVKQWGLHNPEMLTQLYDVCSDLMQIDTQNRPSLDNITKTLAEIKKNIDVPLKVSIIDVSAYQKASKEVRGAMIAELRDANEVVVINTDPTDLSVKDSIELRMNIQKGGYLLNAKFYSGENSEAIHQQIKRDYLASQPDIQHLFPHNPQKLKLAQEEFTKKINEMTEKGLLDANAGNMMIFYSTVNGDTNTAFDLLQDVVKQIKEMHAKAEEYSIANNMAFAESYRKAAHDLAKAEIDLISEHDLLSEEDKQNFITVLNKLAITADLEIKITGTEAAPEPSPIALSVSHTPSQKAEKILTELFSDIELSEPEPVNVDPWTNHSEKEIMEHLAKTLGHKKIEKFETIMLPADIIKRVKIIDPTLQFSNPELKEKFETLLQSSISMQEMVMRRQKIQRGEIKAPLMGVKQVDLHAKIRNEEKERLEASTSPAQAPIVMELTKRLVDLHRGLDVLDQNDRRGNNFSKIRAEIRSLIVALETIGEKSPYEKLAHLEAQMKRISKQVYQIAPDLNPQHNADVKEYTRKYKKMVAKYDRWVKTEGKSATLLEMMEHRQAMERELNLPYTNYADIGRLPLYTDQNQKESNAKKTLSAVMQGLKELNKSDLFTQLNDAQLQDIKRLENKYYYNLQIKPSARLPEEINELTKTAAQLSHQYMLHGDNKKAINILDNTQKVVEKFESNSLNNTAVVEALSIIKKQGKEIKHLQDKNQNLHDKIEAMLKKVEHKQSKKDAKAFAKIERQKAKAQKVPDRKPESEVTDRILEVKNPVERLKIILSKLNANTSSNEHTLIKGAITQLMSEFTNSTLSSAEKERIVLECQALLIEKRDLIARDIILDPEAKKGEYLERLRTLDEGFKHQKNNGHEPMILKNIIAERVAKREQLDIEFDVEKNAKTDDKHNVQKAIYTFYNAINELSADPRLILAATGDSKLDRLRMKHIEQFDQQRQIIKDRARLEESPDELTKLAKQLDDFNNLFKQIDKDKIGKMETLFQEIEANIKTLSAIKSLSNESWLAQTKIKLRESMTVLRSAVRQQNLAQYHDMLTDKLYSVHMALAGKDFDKAMLLVNDMLSNDAVFVKNYVMAQHSDKDNVKGINAMLINIIGDAAFIRGELLRRSSTKKYLSSAEHSSMMKQAKVDLLLAKELVTDASKLISSIKDPAIHNKVANEMHKNTAALSQSTNNIGLQMVTSSLLNSLTLFKKVIKQGVKSMDNSKPDEPSPQSSNISGLASHEIKPIKSEIARELKERIDVVDVEMKRAKEAIANNDLSKAVQILSAITETENKYIVDHIQGKDLPTDKRVLRNTTLLLSHTAEAFYMLGQLKSREADLPNLPSNKQKALFEEVSAHQKRASELIISSRAHGASNKDSKLVEAYDKDNDQLLSERTRTNKLISTMSFFKQEGKKAVLPPSRPSSPNLKKGG